VVDGRSIWLVWSRVRLSIVSHSDTRLSSITCLLSLTMMLLIEEDDVNVFELNPDRQG
jgi:hypothetical protein